MKEGGTVANPQNAAPFQLGEQVVDPSRNVIIGPSGESTIEPRVMAVLLVLTANASGVVSREAIIENVWRSQYSGDESLTRAISILRRALGDSRGKRSFIETVPKRGYRLLVKAIPVARENDTRDGPENIRQSVSEPAEVKIATVSTLRRKSLFFGVAGMILAAVIASSFLLKRESVEGSPDSGIGVISLEKLGPINADGPEKALRGSIHQAIPRSLALVGVDAVYADAQTPAEMKVTGVIENREAQLFATVRIEEPNTGIALWTGRFSQDDDSPSQFTERIARAIADMLKCTLRRRVEHPNSPRQYHQLLMSACQHFRAFRTPEFRLAADQLARAAPQDTNAQSMKAAAYAIASLRGHYSEEKQSAFRQSALYASEAALALEPQNGEAIFAKAVVEIGLGNYAAAENALRRAIEMDPEYPLSRYFLYAHILYATGQVSAARLVNQEALAIDPLSNDLNIDAAYYDILYHTEINYSAQRAENIINSVLAGGYDPNAGALRFQLDFFYGDVVKARASLTEERGGFSRSRENLDCADIFLSAREEQRVLTASDIEATCNPNSTVFYLPRMLAWTGDVDRLFQIYEAPINRIHSLLGELWPPEWDSFRADPRFMGFAARNGLAQYWLETDKWPDFCSTQNDLPYDCRESAESAVDRLQ